MARTANGTGSSKSRPGPRAPAPEIVDPIWLIKAFFAMVLVALACAYATLCGLFYRGQWQLVLHPSRTSAPPSSVAGLPFNLVHFGSANTGIPQLAGWWIPAAAGAPYAHLTILYLPGGDGSLAGNSSALHALHDVGVPIFAIDYRGYGQSSDLRPSQSSMSEDASTAWEYLTGPRSLPGERVIPYGSGLGAALALNLASTHGLIPAVILDGPDFHVTDRVKRDSRARFLPIGILFHDRFDLLPVLDEIRTPKLILTRGPSEDPAVHHAADPGMTVALPPSSSPEVYTRSVRRFLDQYAPPSAMPRLVPTPAP